MPNIMKSKKSKQHVASIKGESDLDKAIRRLKIDAKARSKKADRYALCGNCYYSVSPYERELGVYWRTCARCGNPLQYYPTYEEAQLNRRACCKAK